MESRFAIGNGFLGVRGSLEQPTVASRPRTFIAGLFDGSQAKPPVPSLVTAPDWLRFELLVNGEALSLERGRTLDHSRSLDFRRGLLLSNLKQELENGVAVVIRALRFVSLQERGAGVLRALIEVGEPARLELEVSLGPLTESLEEVGETFGVAIFRVKGRPQKLAVGATSRLLVDGALLSAEAGEPGVVRWSWAARPNQTADLTRIVGFAKAGSVDLADRGVRGLVRPAASAARVERLYRQHLRAWQRRWLESDTVVEGDDVSQRALRFALYHLISAANPRDEHVSIGARALSGDGYKGHVFWDTEIFLLPFYTLTWPAAARSLLMYRFHTLPAACAKAETLGFRGALYAWESADTGEETTPPFALGPQRQVIPIRSGVQEHHISADIAYAVWKYWQATRDTRFLLDAGAEILLETSRFWASRARLEDDDRYHIRDVIGPDEYHEGVDDNAYTNVMATFNLECGLKVAGLLERRWPDCWAALKGKLVLSSEELALWKDVQQKLFTGFDKETGIFEQFSGFFALEEVDLKAFASRTAPMDVVLGPERTRRSQVIKQADVVMLLALLGDQFDRRVHEANFAYYEPRTGHGSSLSPASHAMVAARLAHVELAKRLFDETAAIDLDDTMGNAAAGVHIAALGGLWQAAVFGFAGLQIEDSGLRLDPHLPEDWRRLAFPIQWRGRLVRIEVEREPAALWVTLERGRPVSVTVGGLKRRLGRSEVWRCARDASGRWEEVAS